MKPADSPEFMQPRSAESAPIVTLVSPCFNHSRFVIESLDSIRLQTYPNIRHIIIDDASSDDSAEKIEEWIAQYNYECIFIRHTTNAGISRTLNESIQLSKGTYWSALSTDDIAVPERTQRLVDYLDANPQCEMVVTDATAIDERSMPREESSFSRHYTQHRRDFNLARDFGTYESLIPGNYIAGSLMIRSAAFARVGLFDPGLKVEDWDMWLRISVRHRIGYIDEPLTKYRIHGSNAISNVAVMRRDCLTTLLRQKRLVRSFHLEDSFRRAIEMYLADFMYNRLYREAILLGLREHPTYLFRLFTLRCYWSVRHRLEKLILGDRRSHSQ